MIESLNVALIGFSGHGLVAYDIIEAMGHVVIGYCDKEEKHSEKFDLRYFGDENENLSIEQLKEFKYFISIGSNELRKKIYQQLTSRLGNPINAIHPSSIIARSSTLGNGCMVAANATINPEVKISNGVICNTGSIIEHECLIESFSHIAPGATLCGNVCIGESSFVGANSVIKQGVKIGNNVFIGAGTVVINDVPDNTKLVGNPQRKI